MKRTIVLAALFSLLTACTSLEPAIDLHPSPSYSLVDPSKVDAVAYGRDFTQCAEIANQNKVDVTDKVSDIARTAANKASFGVMGSAKTSEAERGSVLRKCLTGRGHAILR